MATYRLAQPQAEWLAQQVAAGAADSEEAYLARLVEADRAHAAKVAAFNAAIDEGFASGFVEMTVEEIFAEARRQHDAAVEPPASQADDARKLAILRAEVAKGLASGISPHTPDEIFARVLARHGEIAR